MTWVPLIQTSVIILLGIIGYLFAQNVIAMRRENTQLSSALARLQDAQIRDTVHIATVTARVDALTVRVETLERRRKHSTPSPDSAQTSGEET